MQMPCWMIKALQPVTSSMESPSAASRAMKPVGSRGYPRDDDPTLWCGQTTWAWEEHGFLCAVGWDWVEIQRHVLVMADPMSIITNVEFVSEENEELCTERVKLILLNSIIYLLPWQKEALGSLGNTLGRQSIPSESPKTSQGVAYQRMQLAA
jgi:hypothetical protein